jgi:rare lipoprotein A
LRRIALITAALAAGGSVTETAKAYTSQASWYGPGLYGNSLACGGTLSTSTWGVAHKSLPCGTRLTICYQRCVRVSVVDRGPYVDGREFDLTYPVRQAIGMPGVGTVRWWIRR